MPTSCVAFGCNQKLKKGCGISFHRFPKCPIKRQEWIHATKRANWFPSSTSRICSKHFEDTCFYKLGQRIELRENAVPTLFDFSKPLVKKSVFHRPPYKRLISMPDAPVKHGNELTIVEATSKPSNEHCRGSFIEEGTINTPMKCDNELYNVKDVPKAPTEPRNELSELENKCDTPTIHDNISSVLKPTSLYTSYDHSYSVESPTKLKRKLDEAYEKLDEKTKRIKVVLRSNARIKQKLTLMKEVISNLRSQNALMEETLKELMAVVPTVPLDLLQSNKHKSSSVCL